MAVILIPTDFAFDAFGMSYHDFSYTESSEATGDSADRLGGPPRWGCSIASLEKMTPVEAGKWQSLIMRLRGGVNHLGVFDPIRNRPEGTLRGTPTLVSNVAAGDTAMNIYANGTILEGDLLQIGTGVGTSQLIAAIANRTPSGGQMVVQFEPPLRYGFAAGTSITWDYPRFYAKAKGSPASWQHAKGSRTTGSFKIDCVENW